MGSVHHEQVSDGKNCHEWYTISFSELDTVKSLIKNRSEFDTCYHSKLFESKHPYISNGSLQFYEIIECIYLDLERLINNARLTEKHKGIIKWLMYGYTEQDIAESFNTDVRNITNTLNTICKRIVDQNNEEWEKYIETSGIVKIPNNIKYKQCSKCGEWKRINDNNFRKHPNTKDCVQSRCRLCERK